MTDKGLNMKPKYRVDFFDNEHHYSKFFSTKREARSAAWACPRYGRRVWCDASAWPESDESDEKVIGGYDSSRSGDGTVGAVVVAI